MDIKEIALKVADETDAKYPWNMNQGPWIVSFAEALIKSYKEGLLKEVGEPVLYAEFAEDGGWLGDASEYADHLEEPHALFTSDQLAAAILKATGPLEDEVKAANSECELFRKNGRIVDANKIVELRAQLAAAQEEIQKLRQDLLTSYGESEELSGQLATAEQRVAEACAKIYYGCSSKGGLANWKARFCAKAIRSGEWRKFMKGEQ